MVKNIHILLSILFLSSLFSCNSSQKKNAVTYIVSYSDFEDISILDGVVEPVNSIVVTCPRDIDGIVVFLVEDGTFVEEGEVICIIEDQNLQTRYDRNYVDLENALADLGKTEAELLMQYALLEAQVNNNEADAKIANLDSLQLLYATVNQRRIMELELEKTAIEKVKYEKKLEALEIIQQSELKKRKLEIERLKNNLKTAEEGLESLTVKAPKKGLATRPVNWVTGKKLQTGDNVWNNMPLIIIPDMDKMKVKIMAPEKDFKIININDSVAYTFDAMPINYAYGKILKKTPIGQQIERDSKVKLFEIEASIDSTSFMPEPGYTANCYVVLKQVKDTIVIPHIAVFDEDSIKAVYVQQKNGYERRQIIPGLSSHKETIVSQGLKNNEIVALTKPKANQIKSHKFLEKDNLLIQETESDSLQVNEADDKDLYIYEQD